MSAEARLATSKSAGKQVATGREPDQEGVGDSSSSKARLDWANDGLGEGVAVDGSAGIRSRQAKKQTNESQMSKDNEFLLSDPDINESEDFYFVASGVDISHEEGYSSSPKRRGSRSDVWRRRKSSIDANLVSGVDSGQIQRTPSVPQATEGYGFVIWFLSGLMTIVYFAM